MTNKTQKIHISEIQHGDTVIINGEWHTIGRNDIKNNPTWTLMGNPHRETKGIVERVLFRKWFKGEIIDWRPQI